MSTISQRSSDDLQKPKNFLEFFAVFVSTFCYSGYFRYAPGTLASLITAVLWVPFVFSALPTSYRLLATAVLLLIGVVASHLSLKFFDSDDPGSIVIDEVMGQSLALIWAAPSWMSVFLGFVLFRLFDIFKPWPIRVLDRRIKGAWGVMLDDLAAGVFAAVTLLLIHQFFMKG